MQEDELLRVFRSEVGRMGVATVAVRAQRTVTEENTCKGTN